MIDDKKINPSSIIHHLLSAQGWKRNLLAFTLGVLATLTLAPFYIFPLVIPAFTGLYLLVEAAPTRRRAFLDGWWWGWGYYITGLYWFSIALMTDPEQFAWLIPFALFALTGIIAIYQGLACWIAWWLPIRGLTGIFIFSSVWLGIEYARGHLLTGFPWNLAGYSFGFSDVSLQLASILGAYGLTWFTVLLGASFAVIAGFRVQGSGFRKGIIFIVIAWGLFVISLIWGAWRLHAAGDTRYVPGVMLRLVQGDVAQSDKWDPALRIAGVRQYIRLTQSPGMDKVTHIIWPETAAPYAIEPDSLIARALGATIPQGKVLITGALRVEGTENDFKIWNSLLALDHNGDIVGSYDKTRLVPFGEFLPFRRFLPKILQTPAGSEDFSRGRGAETVTWPGLPPLSPLICYEAIFPDSAVDPAHRPQLLLNVTNDAWFGTSSGPHQHFEMARMRAVEQGMPLVRAANTGISAIIDSYGRIVAELPLGAQGIIDHALPQAQSAYTINARFNNIIILLLILIPLLLILYQRRRQKN